MSGETWLKAPCETHGIVVGAIARLPEERLDELIALYELLDPALPRVDRAAAERALSASGVTVFAAVDPRTQRLMGVATLIAVPTLARTRAWAEDLVVHPDFRGRGVGEALMNSCAEAAAGMGARSIDGTVHPDRTSAVSLYRRTGWEFSASLAVRRHV